MRISIVKALTGPVGFLTVLCIYPPLKIVSHKCIISSCISHILNYSDWLFFEKYWAFETNKYKQNETKWNYTFVSRFPRFMTSVGTNVLGAYSHRGGKSNSTKKWLHTLLVWVFSWGMVTIKQYKTTAGLLFKVIFMSQQNYDHMER